MLPICNAAQRRQFERLLGRLNCATLSTWRRRYFDISHSRTNRQRFEAYDESI
jgi:hypothetical protein